MPMRYILAALLLLLPVAVSAQVPQSAQANFASALAGSLSNALAENDQLKAQVADLQKKLADVAKAPPVTDKKE